MMKRICLILCTGLISLYSAAQSDLVAGPMLGTVDLREASVWFQFSGPEARRVMYWKDGEMPSSGALPIAPDPEYNNSIIIRFQDLEPGTIYHYQLDQDDRVWTFRTQPQWAYRTDPPPFRLALGSCTYINEDKYDRPGKPYGGQYEIFESIRSASPDLMLWLGDNVYFREPDWNSKRGMIHRYSHTRKTPELQSLLSSCPHYAIWDDHDFGPNDANGSFIHKDWSLDVFRHFWANPSYGVPGTDASNGITTQFSWGDVDFFLLDNRFNRVAADVKGVQPTILGEDQISWLIQALKYSRSPFKIVALGGQFLNTVDKYENYQTVATERKRLLELINENRITGVIFLTGDRHHGELSKFELADGNVVYDLTSSPLTSTAYNNIQEPNEVRIEGTFVAERNFATIDFSGPLKARVARITMWDSSGKMLWDYTIKAAQP